MAGRKLKPGKLTANAFAPFGDVIEPEAAAEERSINYGLTTRYHDLARLDLTKDNGTPLVNIFRTTPMERPIQVRVMERHPLSSQAFYPLGDKPYLVVVAPAGEFNPDALKAFVASPGQGVNYHAGTWHHYSLALEDVSDFLVIDRGGPETNCDEVFLDEENPITIDY